MMGRAARGARAQWRPPPTYYIGQLEKIAPSGVLSKYIAAVGAIPTVERVGTGGSSPPYYLLADA